MNSNKTPLAIVEQSSPSKVPVLTAGDISPAVMRQYENACKNYFVHKKVAGDDQVPMIVGGLMDSRVSDWIDADHARILELSFDDFLIEFKEGYLDEDWEDDMRREVLGMSQGSKSFWDYAVSLQHKNSLLHGTPSHLSEEQIRHQLGAGMEVRLSKKIGAKKVNKIENFHKWLNEVKRFDDQLRANREEYERILKESREATRQVNTASEPNRCVPNNTNSFGNAAASSSTSVPRKQCPALLSVECQLLKDNEGCLKCRRFFVDHRAANCPNNFPSPTNYKTLTQTKVDRAKRNRNRPIAAVTLSPATAPPTVADTSGETPHASQYHHVAAVMGMSSNPTAYVASNASNVLKTSDSDSESE
jgi:hypothetical protein